MLILLASSLFGSAAWAQPRLFSVEIGAAEFMRGVSPSMRPTWNKDVYEDLTVNAIPQPVFYITFNEGDSFRFVVPASLFSSVQEFGALGFTQYMYKLTYADGRFIYPTLPIPNKLLRIREAFLTGEKYWNDALAESGLNISAGDPDQTIDVFIGHFSEETANAKGGYAAFGRREIRLPQDISGESIELTPLHELFHFVTYSVLRAEAGNHDEFAKWEIASDVRAGTVMWESTARWSEDEPIELQAVPGRAQTYNSDSGNQYFCPNFLERYQAEFFERNQYCAALLIKYYTEQISGGADGSQPQAVLQLISRAHRLNPEGLTRDGWVRALAEGVPAERFPGDTWQERWQKFYAGFAATVLVQNANIVGPDANGLLGIHDEGSHYIKNRPEGFLDWPRFYSDYLNVPRTARQIPAQDDAERARRLASIANTSELQPGASAYFRIDATRNYGPQLQDRSIFLYAYGIPGTSAFALRRKEPVRFYGEFSPFTPLEDFEFPTGLEDVVIQEPALGNDEAASDVFYVGLVNSGPEQVERQTQWSYLISPRILSAGGDVPNPNYPAPVRLISGAPLDRGSKTEFHSGDSFVFETQVTGRVHARGARWQDIPRDQRTIDLELICEGSALPIKVTGDSRDKSMRVDVTEVKTGLESRPTVYKYTFSGTIDEDNTLQGDCVARLSLTSLLNLGAGDSQIDESFKFQLSDTPPEVLRFQVTSNGEVIYDSGQDIFQAATPENGAYSLGLKVWFSTDLAENGASLSAGLRAPYDTFEIPANTNYSDAVFWSKWYPNPDEDLSASLLQTEILVPESAVPDGGFMFFSIMAISKGEILLDADPVEPGEQRDNSHFVTLNLDDYYTASISFESETTQDEKWSPDPETRPEYFETRQYHTTFYPFQAQFILKPGVSLYARPKPDAGLTLLNWQQAFDSRDDVLSSKQREQTELLQEFAGRKDEDDAEETAQIRQNLEDIEQEIAALIERQDIILGFDTDFRLMIRLLQGASTYYCDIEYANAIPARFGGMTSTYQFLGTYPYRGVGTSKSTGTLPAWASNDISSEWTNTGSCPQVLVWRYDLQELRRAREIVLTPPDVSPLEQSDRQMSVLFRDTLWELSKLSWRFTAQSFDLEYGQELETWFSPTQNPGAVFPALVEGPLMRVFIDNYDIWPFPVREGSGIYFRSGDYFELDEGETETGEYRIFLPEGEEHFSEDSGLERYDIERFLRNQSYNDVEWTLDDPSSGQITGYTHSAPPREGLLRLLSVIGVPNDGRLVGSVRGEESFREGNISDYTNMQNSNTFGWAIEWQGRPGEFPWPEKTVADALDLGPGNTSDEGNEQPVGDNPQDGETNDNPVNEGTNAEENNPPGTPLVPDEDVGEDSGEGQNSGIVTEATIKYPGVVEGVISYDEAQYAPGNIVVYLQGDALPPKDEQPKQMELNDGFPQSFIAIPVGSSIRFHNGEGKRGATYRISTSGELADFDHVIAPGREQIGEFNRVGRLTINIDVGAQRKLEIMVLPSTRFNVLESSSYIIRDVPPGNYLLTVETQNRRYRPISTQIEFPPTGPVQKNFELVLR